MINLLSRIRSTLDMGSHNQNTKDDEYGNPAARRLYTKAWITNHAALFHTTRDSELLAETRSVQLHQTSLDALMCSATPKSKTSIGKKDTSRKTKCSSKSKIEANKLEEVDSGLPGTSAQTNSFSVKESIRKPACDSCQSLLKSLCNGCHYKFQTQTPCYFFSVFKKSKSKKLKKAAPPLCSKCKAIVTSEHEPPSPPIKSKHSNDLPQWARQRKYLLHKRQKSICRKPKRQVIGKTLKDYEEDRTAIRQEKKVKSKSRYTSCFQRCSRDLADDKHFGSRVFSKLKKTSKGTSKKTNSCVKGCKTSTQCHVAVPNTQKYAENDKKELSACSQRKIREESPTKKVQGHLRYLKKICPCDAACEFCEDFKLNWRLLTTLPKNWGTVVRDRGGQDAACQ